VPQEKLSMRKTREILRLQASGLSARQILPSVGVAHGTVADCLCRVTEAGPSWPLPPALDDAAKAKAKSERRSRHVAAQSSLVDSVKISTSKSRRSRPCQPA